MHLINDNMNKISALCKKYKVKSLYVFGSILTSRFYDKSDIDFSVTFYPEKNPFVSGRNFRNFYMELEDLFNRRIDLVDESIVKNPYFKAELDATKQLIYG